MKPKVKVYSTSTCYFCIKLREFLKKNKISFEEVDVNSDKKAAMEMIQKSRQTGVPVSDVDGEIITGFDEVRLKKLLKLK